eukprot:3037793-Rhodomonas_salina.1
MVWGGHVQKAVVTCSSLDGYYNPPTTTCRSIMLRHVRYLLQRTLLRVRARACPVPPTQYRATRTCYAYVLGHAWY